MRRVTASSGSGDGGGGGDDDNDGEAILGYNIIMLIGVISSILLILTKKYKNKPKSLIFF